MVGGWVGECSVGERRGEDGRGRGQVSSMSLPWREMHSRVNEALSVTIVSFALTLSSCAHTRKHTHTHTQLPLRD